MGGPGSTRWRQHTKKRTIEKCFVLEANRLVKAIGRENLSRPFECSGIIGQQFYFEFVNREDDEPLLILEIPQQASNAATKEQEILFISSPGTAGGVRWWFVCPRCERQVGKLYLPPGETAYACRSCHELTYKSAQTAHRYDRLNSDFKDIGASLVLLKRAEKAQARFNRYQRFSKGKLKAFMEYMRIVRDLGNVLNAPTVAKGSESDKG